MTRHGSVNSNRSDAGRILVVQTGMERSDTLEQVHELVSTRAETVDDVYEAICTVGLAGAEEEVHTVLVPITIPEFSARSIFEAFQIGDARVRLVLVAPAGRQDAIEAALAEGFDDAIELPAGPTQLRRALGLASDPLMPRRTVEVEPPPGRPAGFDPTPPEEAAPPPTVRSLLEREEPSWEAMESLEEAVAESEDDGERLGDVHLVQAIIDDDGSFHSISLSMIRAHLGTGDIHLLLPEETDDIDVRATALIECDDEHVATLVSSTVGADDLRPWASWLSTWMALERRMRGLETLTETDQLTGAGNRRAFERICAETLQTARQERRIVTLMVFDIDNFKSYNDRYGHEAGDEVLRETVDLLRCTIRRGDHVFRIGGDEFVVIFSDNEGPRNEQSSPPESVEDIAHRFQAKVCELRFPQLGLDAEGSLSISAGLATFPWDGHDGPSLLRHADRLAMESKRAGKNAIRFGPGARGRCEGDGDPDLLA